MTLALAPIDTSELTSLSLYTGATAFEVLQRERVDFTVEKQPVYLPNGRVIPKQWANVRTDTGAALGIVGDRYQVIQNRSGLDLFDVAAAKGAIEYGRAGTFKGGAITWLQARLPGAISIGARGDEVAKYLLLANSHDGSGALRILLTPIRVVCRNTLAMALRADVGMSIRHTSSAEEKVALAIAAIQGADAAYLAFAEQARSLYSRQLTHSQVRGYVEAVFPHVGEGKPSARLEATRRKVIDLVDDGQGHYAIAGTAWAAYNAVAEYTDHHRATRGDESNRLESAWFGTGAAVKRRALDLAHKL